MKISGFSYNSINLMLNMECSKCGSKLKGMEHFCPNCGRKLVSRRQTIAKDEVVRILNDVICGGSANPDKKPDGEEGKGGQEVAAGPKNDSAAPPSVYDRAQDAPVKGSAKDIPWICVRGDASGCEHCRRTDGACMLSVMSLCPPLYRVCPFKGKGYVQVNSDEAMEHA